MHHAILLLYYPILHNPIFNDPNHSSYTHYSPARPDPQPPTISQYLSLFPCFIVTISSLLILFSRLLPLLIQYSTVPTFYSTPLISNPSYLPRFPIISLLFHVPISRSNQIYITPTLLPFCCILLRIQLSSTNSGITHLHLLLCNISCPSLNQATKTIFLARLSFLLASRSTWTSPRLLPLIDLLCNPIQFLS